MMTKDSNNPKPLQSHVHFVHTLLRARDWQDRPELDEVIDWWGRGGAGVCALIGIGGAGKTAIIRQLETRRLQRSRRGGY